MELQSLTFMRLHFIIFLSSILCYLIKKLMMLFFYNPYDFSYNLMEVQIWGVYFIFNEEIM